MKTRFAPSPTGHLHLGNIKIALLNFLLSKKFCGDFVLRIEDTDRIRSKKKYMFALYKIMRNLDFRYQSIYKQSCRKIIYNYYYHILQNNGYLYPCFCKHKALDIIKSNKSYDKNHSAYKDECKTLSITYIKKKVRDGQKYVLRLNIIKDKKIIFDDLVKKKQNIISNYINNFIIKKSNGYASFIFSNIIDDYEMNITHILRGEDHLSNTGKQLMIINCLKYSSPIYGHIPMVMDLYNQPLSKRFMNFSIKKFLKLNFDYIAIINYVIRTSCHIKCNDILRSKMLVSNFNIVNINKSAAKFDFDNLKYFQIKIIQQTNIVVMKIVVLKIIKNIQIIKNYKVLDFIKIIRNNILCKNEFIFWAITLFSKSLKINSCLINYRVAVTGLYFIKTNNIISFHSFIKKIKQKSNISKGILLKSIRIILTGQTFGPKLEKIFNIMEYAVIKTRFVCFYENYKKQC